MTKYSSKFTSHEPYKSYLKLTLIMTRVLAKRNSSKIWQRKHFKELMIKIHNQQWIIILMKMSCLSIRESKFWRKCYKIIRSNLKRKGKKERKGRRLVAEIKQLETSRTNLTVRRPPLLMTMVPLMAVLRMILMTPMTTPTPTLTTLTKRKRWEMTVAKRSLGSFMIRTTNPPPPSL